MNQLPDGRLGFGRAFRIASVLACILLAGACSSSPSPTNGPGGSAGPGGSGGPASSGSVSPAARATLDAALAALTGSSEFTSRVTVDGALATSATGRTVGQATSLTITTAGRTVEYVRVPPNAWAREPGGTWVVVDADEAPDSPLAALAAPLTLVADPGNPATVLTATYPATALGLTGDPASVTITVAGTTVTFEYQATTSGRTVVSTTTLQPATDTTPIATPAA